MTRATNRARDAWLGKTCLVVRHACFSCCEPWENCSFCPGQAQLGQGQTLQRGESGIQSLRVGGPGVLKGAWSDLREQVAVASRSVKGVRGPGPESKRAAWPLVKSLSLHPRPVGRGGFTPHRAWTSLDSWAGTSLDSLNWKVSFGPTGPSLCWLLEQNSALKVMRRLPVRCARCRLLEVARGARIAPSGGQDGRWSEIWT